VTCIRLILLTALAASGCTIPRVQEHPDPVQATVAPTPPCQTPAHLVRDLTVPWNLRTYVIAPCPGVAPCPGAGSTPVSAGPAAPASALQRSASERLAP